METTPAEHSFTLNFSRIHSFQSSSRENLSFEVICPKHLQQGKYHQHIELKNEFSPTKLSVNTTIDHTLFKSKRYYRIIELKIPLSGSWLQSIY